MIATESVTQPVITLTYSDGIQGVGFSVENPSAQCGCGCGQSFS
jgi:Fe-S cluster assembly iron-binding protein IscA